METLLKSSIMKDVPNIVSKGKLDLKKIYGKQPLKYNIDGLFFPLVHKDQPKRSSRLIVT